MRLIRVLLVSLLCLTAGCSQSVSTKPQPEQSASVPTAGGTITLAMTEEPDTLDVQASSMLVTEFIGGYLGGALLSEDEKTMQINPSLATSYTVSEDGKTWTFTLRSDIRFHDGTPLTSNSFKETFERARSKEFAQQSTGSSLSSIESITVPDDQTLVLHMKQPSAPLLSDLASPGWAQPLSLQAIEKAGKQYGRSPVGVGAWKFESWKPGESISMARNPDFHWADASAQNQGPVKPDKLEIRFIKNSQTMLAALDSGSLDVATNVQAKDAKKYRSNEKFTVHEQLKSGLGLFIGLNLQKEIFQDIGVRKALNMAVNKEAIVQASLQGEGVQAFGPLGEAMFGYDPSIKDYAYSYQPEEAGKLLEETGWKLNAQGLRERNGTPLRVHLLSIERFSQSAQLVQGMLKDVGIEVVIDTLEPAAMIQTALSGDYDMTVMGYGATDPDVLFQYLHSSQRQGGSNFSDIADEQIDKLLEKGRVTVNTDERKQIYVDLQKRMVEQAYWVPIFTEKKFTVINNRVHEVRLHPLGYPVFQDSWVEQ
ncbi:ABC transporter substrate-binding protein [Brevibacillus choshinensis]|uniref:ABC transporter substrate-binding protein n=1 Tax=Brevibacillus choshinensis TaxID=54911 RepID=UPI002E209132|nr:ABC transporter substrate-binding protein [Brevibacillus choshinensis]